MAIGYNHHISGGSNMDLVTHLRAHRDKLLDAWLHTYMLDDKVSVKLIEELIEGIEERIYTLEMLRYTKRGE